MYKVPDIEPYNFKEMFEKFNPRKYHAVSRITNKVDVRLSALENTIIWGISNL